PGETGAVEGNCVRRGQRRFHKSGIGSGSEITFPDNSALIKNPHLRSGRFGAPAAADYFHSATIPESQSPPRVLHSVIRSKTERRRRTSTWARNLFPSEFF